MNCKYFLIWIVLFPLVSLAQVRNDAGLRGDEGAVSGFFETDSPLNYPQGAFGWWHLLDVRHSNLYNNYAMQFSGSFFDRDLYFRKTINNPSAAWSKVLLEIDGKSLIDGQSWMSYGNNNINGYSWTNAALTTNSIEIVNNNGIVSNSSPTLAFHRYGSGGPQFRLAADGSNVLYLESSSENSARNPNAYGGNLNAHFKKFYIDADLTAMGNVGIGTTIPQERLSVNGNIRAKEIKVESTNWPDYVFEKDYKKLSLAELEKFIQLNKHLPEMPSAAAIESNGLALGDMVKLQQKKIEELTLHLIEKDKQITAQQERFNQLERRIFLIEKK